MSHPHYFFLNYHSLLKGKGKVVPGLIQVPCLEDVSIAQLSTTP